MSVKALATPDPVPFSAGAETLVGHDIGISATASDYPAPETATMQLADGRCLAYDDLGRPEGFPILYFHSAGSSRLECRLFEASAGRSGFRLIAADRPGIGGSDFRPGLGHDQISADLIELADFLDLNRFGLLSHTSGGIFALSLAHHFSERVCFVLSLGGMAGNSGWLPGQHNSLLATLARSLLPGFIGLLTRLRHSLTSAEAPDYLECLQAELSYTDRKVLADPAVTDILQSALTESYRQGAVGVARDNSLCFADPGFRLQQIRVPVSFWQGRADTLCSRSFNEYLAARIPTASCHSVANRGHFFYVHSMDEIFGRTKLFARQ